MARVWSEQLAENLRNLEPDSQYAVLDAQVYSANLPGPGDYYAPEPGVGDSFVFAQVLAHPGARPGRGTPYQAGSGLWEIEDGPYAGWYGWGLGLGHGEAGGQLGEHRRPSPAEPDKKRRGPCKCSGPGRFARVMRSVCPQTASSGRTAFW